MASLHAPVEIAPSPSAPKRPTAAPAPTKLRDSCHACASSKVKCHKEKPTCSRCAKRGITCGYFVTKRVGRKHEKKAPQAISTSSAPASSEMDYLMSPGLLQSSPGNLPTSSSSDSFSNIFSPVDPFLASVLTSLSTGFDDFSNSELFTESSDFDILNQPDFYLGDGVGSKGGVESAFFLGSQDTYGMFDEPASELSNTSRPQSPSNSRDSSTTDEHSIHGVQLSADSSCFCLIRGLGLMKQLSSAPPVACTTSAGEGYQTNKDQTPTIQSVIAENEQVIEAVGNMLQCQCSQDGYLLTIMALIVFKVLGWYAAAARGSTSSEEDDQDSAMSTHTRRSSCSSQQVLQHPTMVGAYHLDEEDLGRMSAQLVLNELHRVQRVVNQLSKKLKACGGENGEQGSIKRTTDGHLSPFLDSDTNSPFSVVMLDQLDADLRKRLRTLSLNIIEMLRRE